MHIETERKFLVKDSSYKQLAVKAYRIKQGYIAHDNGNTVRVRIRDAQGFLTIKGPSMDGISRFEWEREIPLQEAEELFLLCRGGAIDKTRYLIPAGAVPSGTCGHPWPHKWEGPADSCIGGKACFSDDANDGGRDEAKRRVSGGIAPVGKYFEVDEFYGDNEGLVMAEIELESPEEPFDRPAWLGEEVTGDRRYYNSHLLRNPYCLWRGDK